MTFSKNDVGGSCCVSPEIIAWPDLNNEPTASEGVTCEASSNITTSKFILTPMYELTFMGLAIKHGLMLNNISLISPNIFLTGFWNFFFAFSVFITITSSGYFSIAAIFLL
ncbi:hypothetical protein AOG54_03125 [Acidiplasma aeolicum]|uniref:Uncharacterized protein n=1 Tax=Acidiplasma aeolicum TaxID=507754 RepID=A0A0Q0RSN7_9ARCH|nr:hypothetical protein AOG54_03125 [Acidiplasma aeolicum]